MGSTAEAPIFKILVTGFEAFDDESPVNPSYEIAKALPRSIASDADCPLAIEVISHPDAIPVVYDEVRKLVPRLLSQHANSVDMILHIGMATSRTYYTIEELAHRDDYTRHRDLHNEKLTMSDGETYFPDCPRNIRPSLAYEKLWHDWHDQVAALNPDLSIADLQQSDDAGHFLCDYIYLNSLVWYGRENGLMTGGNVLARPVMFLHVPAASDTQALKTGQQVSIGLIRAMCLQYAASRKNV